MGTIKVVVGNSYLNGVREEFICSNVDISNKEEMEYAAEECIGAFVDMHHFFFEYETPDVSLNKKFNACYYTIEEVVADV